MTVKCKCCNREVAIPVIDKVFERIKNRRSTGESIQSIVPELDPALREMFISGICPQCFETLVEDEEGGSEEE